jgi:hypothetical protein
MRLRQLARKLEVNPNRLLEILHENGHKVDNDPNLKLTEEQEVLINSIFPSKKSVVVEEIEETQVETIDVQGEVAPAPKKKVLPKKIELKEPKVKKVEAPKVYSIEKDMEEKTKDVELIKAPKLKLDGLKVVGKIDLPAPKQKPVKEEKVVDEQLEEQPKTKRESKTTDRKRQAVRKPRPSSLELERRRTEREARLKREAEEKHIKELKEKHYKENVLAKQQAQAGQKKKKIAKPLPNNNVVTEVKAPYKKSKQVQKPAKKKSVLGRFWAWLNGAYDNY